ncbi:hypothetical protein HK102_006184 [Quaeritorhiza haematococci]|nr:hypothetical protein HK102_006184 [Quaeritorhiza haematococci]
MAYQPELRRKVDASAEVGHEVQMTNPGNGSHGGKCRKERIAVSVVRKDELLINKRSKDYVEFFRQKAQMKEVEMGLSTTLFFLRKTKKLPSQER